jgi:hypothetical protein
VWSFWQLEAPGSAPSSLLALPSLQSGSVCWSVNGVQVGLSDGHAEHGASADALARAAELSDVRPPLAMPSRKQQIEVLRCSFCNKSQRDVAKLIAGPAVYICNECLEICNQIVAESKLLEPGEKSGPEAVPVVVDSVEVPVRCRLCQMLWPRDRCVAFPDRGWVCDAWIACGSISIRPKGLIREAA